MGENNRLAMAAIAVYKKRAEEAESRAKGHRKQEGIWHESYQKANAENKELRSRIKELEIESDRSRR